MDAVDEVELDELVLELELPELVEDESLLVEEPELFDESELLAESDEEVALSEPPDRESVR